MPWQIIRLNGYEPKQPHKYIMYLDANNLYGLAMVQSLPQSDFKWSDERDYQKLIDKYAENESEGCFVKCDLDDPIELQMTTMPIHWHLSVN